MLLFVTSLLSMIRFKLLTGIGAMSVDDVKIAETLNYQFSVLSDPDESDDTAVGVNDIESEEVSMSSSSSAINKVCLRF